ncbi:MAG: flagellar filament capping protein FliD [Gammaproteobacteria bacterium]|nr:flagellar filament capping protein FliD [Gammaproteobacteria bacterium]
MAGISATGLGSGLDIEAIISGLMQVERRPLQVLDSRIRDVDTKISGYGALKSALADFQEALSPLKKLSAFEVYQTVSSDEDVFTASADSNAVPGNYSIKFFNDANDPTFTPQLAQAHKIGSAAFATASTSTLASGNLNIAFSDHPDTPSFSITVDGSNDTLEGIRDAINEAADNIGVTASIINVDSGSKLILTSDDTGTNSTIYIGETGNVATTLGFNDIAASTIDSAQNAMVKIDGNLVTSQSNTVKVSTASNTQINAIEGITLNLVALGTKTETLKVENDIESVTASVEEFITAFNKLRGQLSGLHTGSLQGDNTILSVESQLRNVFNTKPAALTTSLGYLSEIGISTTSSGDLSLDKTKLESALVADYDGVAELLADDDQGYMFRFDSYADNLLDIDGLIDSRSDGLGFRKESLEDQRFGVEFRMELIEKRLRDQFTALDTLLAGLNNTSNFLSQQLASLPGSR